MMSESGEHKLWTTVVRRRRAPGAGRPLCAGVLLLVFSVWTVDCGSGIGSALWAPRTAQAKLLDVAGLHDLPPLMNTAQLSMKEQHFAARGDVGVFAVPPSRAGVFYDSAVQASAAGGTPAESEGQSAERTGAVRVMYDRKAGNSFCGAYLMILGDLSAYRTMTFMIKGKQGGETFEIGLNDVIGNRREDGVFIGTIYRFLPQGVTTEWQEVTIPFSDFYGLRLHEVMSLVFSFNEPGSGVFWIDNIRFHAEALVNPAERAAQQGTLLLDNFDHSDSNLLGKRANTFKQLPSVCESERVSAGAFGGRGRSLQLTFKKDWTGWCGYYSLLNFIDGPLYDLSPYTTLSFWVKGRDGGEFFELGMADEEWMIIGDSVKAGPVTAYLPDGVTTEWQRVVIPLQDFGDLDFSRMGSFAINFPQRSEGVIWIDDIMFSRDDES